MNAPAQLALENVEVRYGAASALASVTAVLAPGQVIGLIGPNGAGKTTLLKACAGLVRPNAGRVTLGDRALNAWPAAARARIIGYLPQAREVAWPVGVARLVALGRLPHLASWQEPDDQDRQVVAMALAATDTAALWNRPVTTLSGGELARVLIARLLAGAPEILLADEPIAGLDPEHSLQVMRLFRGLAERGRTVVVVLHDLTMAARFCDRLILLDHGRIVADAAPRTVLTQETLSRHYNINAAIVPFEGEILVVPRSL